MKQITTLLSSLLTLLLITGNNVSYAYELKNVQFQGNKPNMRVSPNRINQGALKNGVISKRNNIGLGFRGCLPLERAQGSRIECKVPPTFGGQEGKVGLSDDTHLGSAIGYLPEPELRSDDNLLPAVQAVQLKFIDGEWK